MTTQTDTPLDRAFALVSDCAPQVLKHADWDEIPTDMGNALLRYLADAHPMGDFLQAVVVGELHWAAARADLDNFEHLGYFGRWILQSWPTDAYGSREKLDAWQGFAHTHLRSGREVVPDLKMVNDDDGPSELTMKLTDAQTMVFEYVVQSYLKVAPLTTWVECSGSELGPARALANRGLLECGDPFEKSRVFQPSALGLDRYHRHHRNRAGLPRGRDDDDGLDPLRDAMSLDPD